MCYTKPMTESLALQLRDLAQRYETEGFLNGDPSSFMHECGGDAAEQEMTAFLAACLSFGSRKQFCKKIEALLNEAHGTPCEWILRGGYESLFPQDSSSFYRMFSSADMRALCGRLRTVLRRHGTLGSAAKSALEESGGLPLQDCMAALFPGCRIIPHTAGSAKKRLCMFLRWMVRQKSPVDLGLWTWYSAADLCIPLDVHVLRQSQRLGLTQRKCADARTARAVTEQLRSVWPDDPCKGDFALFGLGISERERPALKS